MKNNEQLVKDLKALVAQERLVLVDLLRHLREVESRSLHLSLGYSSLFSFCTGELGYTEPEAQARIQAMRLMRDEPTVEEKLDSGALGLSVAARVQGAFRRNKATPEQRQKVLAEIEGKSARETDRFLAGIFPEEAKREKVKASARGTRIEFTASEAAMEKFERLKELLAHKNFEGRFDLLFEELAEIALEKLEPADAPVLRTSKVNHSRYIPAAVKRSLPWKEGCNFQGKQKRCGSRHGLQIDHIHNYADGGTNAPKNLQLLCGAHNRFKFASSNSADTENTKLRSPPPRRESQ